MPSAGRGRPTSSGAVVPDQASMGPNQRAVAHLVAARIGFEPGLDSSVPWAEVNTSLVELAISHGVAMLVVASPDFNRLPEELRERLTRLANRESRAGMRRLSVQASLVESLRSSGIDPLVMKGHALGALAYDHWAARGAAADLDLLVHPQEVSNAEQVLETLGFESRIGRRPPRPGTILARYAIWLHYESAWTSPRFGHVDLHWRALPGGAGWNSADNLIKRSVEVGLPTGLVRTLSPSDYLIVACAQGESENWARLKRLADLAMIASVCHETDIAVAAQRSSLVDQSLAKLPARWHVTETLQPRSSRLRDNAANLWRVRRGSGSIVDAAARSSLGALLPARRLTRAAPQK